MAKGIIQNSVINIFRTSIGVLVPLITMPIIIKVLNEKDLSFYYYYSSLLTFFVLISNFGIPMIAVKDIATTRMSNCKTSYKLSKYVTLNIFLWLISFLLLVTYLILSNEIRFDIVLLIFISMSTVNVEYFFQASENFSFLAARDILFKVLSTIIIFIYLKREQDFVFYCVLLVFISLANSLSGIYFARRIIKFSFKIQFLKFIYLKEILVVFFIVLLNLFIINIDFLLLKIYNFKDIDLASYGVALRFYKLAMMILDSITIVLVSRAYFVKTSLSPNENIFLKNVFTIGLLIATFFFIFLFSTASQFILLFTKCKYPDSVNYLQILSFGIIVSFISNFVNSFILFNYGKIRMLIVINLLSIPFTFSLYYVLLGKFHIIGFVFATSIINMPGILFFLFLNLKNHFIIVYPYFIDFIKISLVGIFTFSVCFFIFQSINSEYVVANILFKFILLFIIFLALSYFWYHRLFHLLIKSNRIKLLIND